MSDILKDCMNALAELQNAQEHKSPQLDPHIEIARALNRLAVIYLNESGKVVKLPVEESKPTVKPQEVDTRKKSNPQTKNIGPDIDLTLLNDNA